MGTRLTVAGQRYKEAPGAWGTAEETFIAARELQKAPPASPEETFSARPER
jgi:hypothetical protein